jgi:bacterioferritin-associated ferredoxin
MAIICHCEGVRDRTIAAAVRRGATDLCSVQAVCGAGTRCEGCVPAVEAIIRRHAGEHAGATSDDRRPSSLAHA